MKIPIKGYEGFYEIEDDGSVYSLDRHDGHIYRKGKKLKNEVTKNGYCRITLSKGGKVKRFLLHRLVYECFKGEIPKGLHIHHINEQKQDNSIQNLLACTARENNHYSAVSKGYKLTQKDVDHIRRVEMNVRQVVDTYKISPRHALRVIKNERWVV